VLNLQPPVSLASAPHNPDKTFILAQGDAFAGRRAAGECNFGEKQMSDYWISIFSISLFPTDRIILQG
jgi:hypothetical protein